MAAYLSRPEFPMRRHPRSHRLLHTIILLVLVAIALLLLPMPSAISP